MCVITVIPDTHTEMLFITE